MTSKRILITISMVAFFMFSFVVPTDNNVFETYNSYQKGEVLTYKIYYNLNFVWVPAGEVVFKVDEDTNSFHFSATGTSYGSYDWFFKVRDKYDTYIDKKTMLPRMSVRDIKEGNYRLYDKVIFDQKNLKALSHRGDNAEKTEKKLITMKEPMYDILSLLYYVRSLDFSKLAKGQVVPIKLFLDEENYPLNMKFEGAVSKDIKDLGKFNCLQISPEVIKGNVFKDNQKMNIWATNDLNHIPLYIESPLAVGSVKVVLKDLKGLKYKLDSKIK
jgi:Protein of unknown function (DUF3108)